MSLEMQHTIDLDFCLFWLPILHCPICVSIINATSMFLPKFLIFVFAMLFVHASFCSCDVTNKINILKGGIVQTLIDQFKDMRCDLSHGGQLNL